MRIPNSAAFAVLTSVAVLPTVLLGQGDDKLPPWRVDSRYTKNDPEAMERAGYVSYGGFVFGCRGDTEVTTEDIDKALPYSRILWVETQHFKIGTALDPWPVPVERKTKRKIRGELEELAQKIPGINPKTRRLDEWLRLHLTAHRLEKLYADFSDRLGVTDADFPTDISEVVYGQGKPYMGYGPYLGMEDKYLVLVLKKQGNYETFLNDFIGRDSKFGQKWNMKATGNLFYGVSTESEAKADLRNDTALHANLYFNVAMSLFDGFRHYSYNTPVWLREGIAHWYGKSVDPRYNNFDQNEGSPLQTTSPSNWKLHTRKLIATGKFTPFPEVYKWMDFGQISMDDHVAIWSRIDFLLSKDKESWRKLMFAIKGRVDEKWRPMPGDLTQATRDALKDAYGLSPLTFDEAWSRWVMETYPTR